MVEIDEGEGNYKDDSPEKDSAPEKEQTDDDILKEARDRMKISVEAWKENRERAIEDLQFRDGDQWPQHIRQEREAEKRPCITINLMEMFIDQVVGDQRQNKISIRVTPVDGQQFHQQQQNVPNMAGDKDYPLAEVYSGLIRNIEYASNAASAYDTAFDHATGHGMGYFRIITEYSDDDSFNQDIRIRRIKNSFTVYLDPSFDDEVGADCMYGFIAKWLPRKESQKRYGQESCLDVGEGIGEEYEHWYEDDRVRMAEYFWKVPVVRELALIQTGETINLGESKDARALNRKMLTESGAQIIRTRMAKSHKVKWCKLNGSHILTPKKDFPSKFIPIIPVFGKELNVQGKSYYRGVIRHAKDPQRLVNYWETNAAEMTALQPRAPYVGTVKQFENLDRYWSTANTENHAYLPYNPDTLAPGRPSREPPPQVPAGYVERARSAFEHLLYTTSLNRSSLGQASGEKSGKAILARQREGDTATFQYSDNLAKAIAHCGRILLDMIPRVYDNERILRIHKPDDTDDFVKVNVKLENGTKVYDLSAGKYDVIVDVGPAYNTRRQEAAEAMLEFMRVVPEARGAIMDRVTAAMDWPESDEITKRLRRLVSPELLAADDNQPPPPPPPPTPQEQMAMQVQDAEAKAKIMKAQADIITARAKMIEAGAKDEDLSNMIAAKVAELFQQLGIMPPQPQGQPTPGAMPMPGMPPPAM